MTAFLTIREVAARLRISQRTAYRLAPEIDPSNASSPLRLNEARFERWLASKLRGPGERRHPLAELIAAEAGSAIAAMPRCCTAEGATYFVAAAGLIKIGRARENLPGRLAQLQAQSPIALELLGIARGADLEPGLHDRFRSWRAWGEWFDAARVLALIGDVAIAGGCLRCHILERRR